MPSVSMSVPSRAGVVMTETGDGRDSAVLGVGVPSAIDALLVALFGVDVLLEMNLSFTRCVRLLRGLLLAL